jgi:hypothetical protein
VTAAPRRGSICWFHEPLPALAHAWDLAGNRGWRRAERAVRRVVPRGAGGVLAGTAVALAVTGRQVRVGWEYRGRVTALPAPLAFGRNGWNSAVPPTTKTSA